MSNSYFKFKQFTVWHNRCGMKVGTDGVLLGAWAPVEQARRILDVGTGTGLIALMLAQRQPQTQLIALDINEQAVEQALENIEQSPWRDRIRVQQTDFLQWQEMEPFDLIVSNPPYFQKSLPCPDEQRSMARHDDTLPYQSLLHHSAELLSPKGLLALVLPFECLPDYCKAAQECGLCLLRQTDVCTRVGKAPKRVLVVFGLQLQPTLLQQDVLAIQQADGTYSEDYCKLTSAFYLNF